MSLRAPTSFLLWSSRSCYLAKAQTRKVRQKLQAWLNNDVVCGQRQFFGLSHNFSGDMKLKPLPSR